LNVICLNVLLYLYITNKLNVLLNFHNHNAHETIMRLWQLYVTY